MGSTSQKKKIRTKVYSPSNKKVPRPFYQLRTVDQKIINTN